MLWKTEREHSWVKQLNEKAGRKKRVKWQTVSKKRMSEPKKNQEKRAKIVEVYLD